MIDLNVLEGINPEDIEEILNRRDFLFKNVPHCPECASVQVQIKRYGAPAIWRCRICKHRFTYEPPK